MTKIIGINGQIDTLRETLVSRKKNSAFPADLSEKDIHFQIFQLKFKKHHLFQLSHLTGHPERLERIITDKTKDKSETLGVVYEVDCNNCLKKYAGQTGRKLKERMK